MKDKADFQLDVVLDSKAIVNETKDGDLIIEGYASDYDTDRDGEAFEQGCFNKALERYMTTNPVILYHHKLSQALGQTLEARLDQKGLWVKARIDKPAPNSWAMDVFQKIKRGTIRGFSVGGQFYRKMTKAGPRIFNADIHEISVTPQPVNPRTLYAVAQKAFPDQPDYEQMLAQLEEVEEFLSHRQVTSRL